MRHLSDPKYREAEARRYDIIDRERKNGLRAGCIECNRRDAHPSKGVCWKCERKIRAELAYLGFDLDTMFDAANPAKETTRP